MGKSSKRLTRSALRRAPSVLGHGDLGLSLVMIFPLFVAYEIGVLFSTTTNGVDFVTRWVFAAAGSRENFLLLYLALALAYIIYVVQLRRRRGFSLDTVPAMLVESTIYAITLGTFIVFVMQELLGFELALALLDGLSLGENGEAVVISLGAGVHEELVFRLALMAGGAAILKQLGCSHRSAVIVALVVSSVLFSAAHHVGFHGDEFTVGVFTYRAIAGAIFATIFYFRSLSHAVYTHFLYDFYVLVVRG